MPAEVWADMCIHRSKFLIYMVCFDIKPHVLKVETSLVLGEKFAAQFDLNIRKTWTLASSPYIQGFYENRT